MLTKKEAIKIMNARGYSETASIQTGGEDSSILFAKNLTDEITINANVELKNSFVSLSFLELKYFCQLTIPRFDVNHKEFDKFENTLRIYIAKCLDVDVFQVLAVSPLKMNAAPAPVTEDDIKTRKRKFWDRIVEIGKKRKYSKEECLKFYNYWTQTNDHGKKMMFEFIKDKKKVFSIEGRLATWMSHDKKFKEEKFEKVDKTVAKQNEEKKSKVINKDEVF